VEWQVVEAGYRMARPRSKSRAAARVGSWVYREKAVAVGKEGGRALAVGVWVAEGESGVEETLDRG
jgi:hypothetical protein